MKQQMQEIYYLMKHPRPAEKYLWIAEVPILARLQTKMWLVERMVG